jgi:heme a synthase
MARRNEQFNCRCSKIRLVSEIGWQVKITTDDIDDISSVEENIGHSCESGMSPLKAMDAHRRAIRLWLYVVAALVVLMVMVGGATRLTDSGLSIVEWRPITGTVPPLNGADWIMELEKYKTSSEYELVNKGMTLEEFKHIYWWEWGHRLLGRVIGVAFVVPLLFFQLRGWIEPKLKWRLWLIFALGGLQGVIGWWMVGRGWSGGWTWRRNDWPFT